MTHRCPAPGCTVDVPARMLMCREHWRMVPRALQQEIWRTYRPGQEKDLQISGDYWMAYRRAVEAVARRIERARGSKDGEA